MTFCSNESVRANIAYGRPDAAQAALERLIEGRTTIVIAHRLSTVVHADRIVVLKKGKIIESGRHRELIRKKGYYASLVDRQTKGLLPGIEGSGELIAVEK